MEYKLPAFSLSLFMSQLHAIIHQKGPGNMYVAIKLQPPASMLTNLLGDMSDLSMSFVIHPKRNRSREETLPVPGNRPRYVWTGNFPAPRSQTVIWNREYRFLVSMSTSFWDFLSFLVEPCLEQDQRNPVKYGLAQESWWPTSKVVLSKSID